MALDVFATAEIDRNHVDVSEYAFEPNHDPVWIGGITAAELPTERPIGVGTRVRRLAKFMGRTIDYILEVTALEPHRRMEMRSIKSPFPMKVTYSFDDRGGGRTLAKVRVEGSASGFYGMADFFMAPMVRSNLKKDLKRLKALMERR